MLVVFFLPVGRASTLAAIATGGASRFWFFGKGGVVVGAALAYLALAVVVIFRRHVRGAGQRRPQLILASHPTVPAQTELELQYGNGRIRMSVEPRHNGVGRR